MNEGFDVTLTYNDKPVKGHIWTNSDYEHATKQEIVWNVEAFKIDGWPKFIMTIIQMPDGTFVEKDRDPLMTTSLQYLVDIIKTEEHPRYA